MISAYHFCTATCWGQNTQHLTIAYLRIAKYRYLVLFNFLFNLHFVIHLTCTKFNSYKLLTSMVHLSFFSFFHLLFFVILILILNLTLISLSSCFSKSDQIYSQFSFLWFSQINWPEKIWSVLAKKIVCII